MFRNGTSQHPTIARHSYQMLRGWRHHQAISPSHGTVAATCRYFSTSGHPQPPSDDQSKERSRPIIRKYGGSPHPVDRRDIDINSLAATVQAHRTRYLRNGSAAIALDAKEPFVVRRIRQRDHEPSPLRGELHWASFEDFQTQHQPGDKEWERRFGSGAVHGGASNRKDTIFSATPIGNGIPLRELHGDTSHNGYQPITIKRIPNKSRKKGKRARTKHFSVGEAQPVSMLYGFTRAIPQALIQAQESFAEHGSSNELLSALILAFERYMTLHPSDHEGIEQSMDHALAIIKAALSDGQMLQVHGSYATNLASPLSDVDLNIALQEDANDWLDRGPSPERDQIRNKRMTVLMAVQKAFREHSSSFRATMTPAQYPILTIEDGNSSLLYQISCGRRIGASTETVRAILDEYPTLRPLFMVLRHALLIRGLNDASTGGCGSYTLLIMILTALKHSKSILMGHGLGQQLLEVLEFWRAADRDGLGYAAIPPSTFLKYGIEPHSISDIPHSDVVSSPIDDDAHTIANAEGILTESSQASEEIAHLQAQNREVRRKSSKSSKVRGYHRHSSQLCLQDPADPINDLGYAVYRMPDVIKTLTIAAHDLRWTIREWENATPEHRIDDPGLNLLRGLVASDLKLVKRRRERLWAVAGSEAVGSQSPGSVE